MRNRFLSVEELHNKVNATSGVDVSLRQQTLLFGSAELKGLARPVTDYGIRAYRNQKAPKPHKPKQAARRGWLGGWLGGGLAEGGAGGSGGKGGGGNDDEPEERLAFYKGRCWGVEAVMYLQIHRESGAIRGKGFSRQAGEFDINGQWWVPSNSVSFHFFRNQSGSWLALVATLFQWRQFG